MRSGAARRRTSSDVLLCRSRFGRDDEETMAGCQSLTALPRADDSIYSFSEAGAVYSPHVLVNRRLEGRVMPQEEHFVVSVVSAAAQDLRRQKPWYQPFDQRLAVEKMWSTLSVAVQHRHTALVLGAFGCGAFKHNPDRTAALYGRLFGPGGEFDCCFEVVVFAIIKSQDNLRAFSACFPFLAADHYVPALQASVGVISSQELPPTSMLSQHEKDFLKHCKLVREIWKLEEERSGGGKTAANQEQKMHKKVATLKNVREMLEYLPEDSALRQKNADVVQAAIDAA